MVNIVICGTPGTGKSTIMGKLKSELENAHFINVSKFAIDNKCTSGYDEEFDTYVIDEDKLDKRIEPYLTSPKATNLIESIHADILPLQYIDWIFVCRTNNSILYDRLKARNYNEKKLSNNIQAEIFQTILDEARDNFNDERRVTELSNDEEEDLIKNVRVIVNKVREISA